MSREFKCCAGCNCCAGSDMCAMEIQIEAPVGQVIGYVKQQSVLCLVLLFFFLLCSKILYVARTLVGPHFQ